MDFDQFSVGWFLFLETPTNAPSARTITLLQGRPWMLRGYAVAAYMTNRAPNRMFDQVGAAVVAWEMLDQGDRWFAFYEMRSNVLEKLIGYELYEELLLSMRSV